MFNLLKSVMSDKSDDDVPRYCTAVIVAAGSGKRMKSEENKQFMKLRILTGNDLETSKVPLSVLFCIIEKNT